METASEKLCAELKAFGKQAIVLCDAITEAHAEEIVTKAYPFAKSFDETVLAILEWSNAVEKVMKKEESKNGI
jgi:hypothetical protein